MNGQAAFEPLFPVAGLPKKSLHKELPMLKKGYDTVIIDGPPRVNDVAQSCIAASDFVLIPVQPSPYDVWAAKEIIDLIHESLVYKPTLKYAFVINRSVVNTVLGRDVADALAGYPVRLLKTVVCQRIALAESAAEGRTVFETDPESLAASEILALVDRNLRSPNEKRLRSRPSRRCRPVMLPSMPGSTTGTGPASRRSGLQSTFPFRCTSG